MRGIGQLLTLSLLVPPAACFELLLDGANVQAQCLEEDQSGATMTQ